MRRERVRVYRDEWETEILPLQKAKSSPTHPARLVYEVGKALPKGGRVYVDIGDVTQYAEAYMKITEPGAWQISPGMAEMGWAASGVLGPVVADGRAAIALVGDGAFNIVSQIVATAVEYDLPAIWVILNNSTSSASSAKAWNAVTHGPIRGVISCARIPASRIIRTMSSLPMLTAPRACGLKTPNNWDRIFKRPLPAGGLG